MACDGDERHNGGEDSGESALEEKLLDITRRGQVPEVGITVSDATISLRILARAANSAEARLQVEPVERAIRERLGELLLVRQRRAELGERHRP